MPPIISYLDFTSTTPPVGPVLLQTMQWDMTAVDKASTTSTGLEIIDPGRTSQLAINGGPRLWNGDEAENNTYLPTTGPGGGTNFGTSAVCTDWWVDNFRVRVRQNGRDWLVMDGSTPGEIFASCQPTYNNIGSFSGQKYWDPYDQWITQADGQTNIFEVYEKALMPENWSTNAVAINNLILDGATLSGYVQGNSGGTVENVIKTSTNYFDNIRIRTRTVDGMNGLQIRSTDGSTTYAPYAAVWWGRDNSTGPAYDWFLYEYQSNASEDFYKLIESRSGATTQWASNNTLGPLGVARYDSKPENIANWATPYGSLMDWDNANDIATFVFNTNPQTGSTNITLNSNPTMWDGFRMNSNYPTIRPTAITWSGTAPRMNLSGQCDSTQIFSMGNWWSYWSEPTGWQKCQSPDAPGGNWAGAIGLPFPNSNYNYMDDAPIVIMFFEDDPGDVSTWRPYDGPDTMILHDAFSGSGSPGGRTPDEVDNTNTWTVWNSELYTVGSDYVSSDTNSNDFSRVISIDAGSTDYTLRSVWKADNSSTWSCGPCIAVTSGTHLAETFAKFDMNAGTFRCVEYNNGSATVTNLGGSFTVTDEFVVILRVSGSTVNYEVYDNTDSLYTYGTHTMSLTSTSVVGMNLVKANAKCYDFQVFS